MSRFWGDAGVQANGEGIIGAEMGSEVVYTCAAEWPSLREALRSKIEGREIQRECDYGKEWRGRVSDGVSDWFL